MTNAPPCRGLLVVEAASGVAGPMAACRLGDLGADVVKVEWDDGDWLRSAPPFQDDGTTGAAFFALNRGKRAVHLGPGSRLGPTLLRRLVERADVLITDEDGAGLERLGIGGADAAPCPWNPRLIVAQLSCYGREGPMAGRPGSEVCAQAFAGYTRYVGERGRPAVRLGADVAGASTAIFTAQAVMAALLARGRSGRGQRIDLSMAGALLAMKTVHLAAQSDPDSFEGPRVGGAYDPPERGWATADRPVTFAFGGAVGAEGRPGWVQFAESVGLGHLVGDPRFDRNGRMTTGLGPKARELKPEYEAGFRGRSSDEVVAAVRRFGGFASAYLTHRQLLAEPQTAALDVVAEVPGGGGPARVLGFPARFSDMATPLRGTAPAIGQHTGALCEELGIDAGGEPPEQRSRSG